MPVEPIVAADSLKVSELLTVISDAKKIRGSNLGARTIAAIL